MHGDPQASPYGSRVVDWIGGDEGDRTPGLDIANVALSQLSYIPNRGIPDRKNAKEHILLIVQVSRHC